MTSKASEWRGHVHGYRASGKSAAAYCAEHGLKVWSLRYWLNKIREHEQRDAQAVAVGSSIRLAQVRTKSTKARVPDEGALQLSVGALSLRVAPGFDREVLRDVLSVVLDVAEVQR